uniref:Myc box-dependent-interacting protein 1 n=1 Tax=Astyanax mexicanus TaxID=7994 RepID=A0A3B1JF02_ASTMX
MAELPMGKGVSAGKIASNVQKKLTRAQEKVMQKLGKADETKDLAFEEGVINFNKQLVEGTKLQKDLRAYLAAVKAMHESSKRLQECLGDMYEPEWYGKDEMDSVIEDSDLLWTDFHQKLVDHALISMDTYLGQFPDIRARIAKRDRKLVDFDSARHTFAAVNKGKKKEGGIKITKPTSLLERATPGWAQGILSAHNVAQTNLSRCQAEEELERAQKVFEDINVDLQEELPSLWNSRVGFYVNTFQSVSGLEEKFHREIGKLSQNMNDILVTLENQDMSRLVIYFIICLLPQDANHTLSPGGPPAIPKSPSKVRIIKLEILFKGAYIGHLSLSLRPAVPPPPKVTPSKDLKQENIINLFDEAATPGISVTSPTEYNEPATSNLLDMDLDSFHAATTPVANNPPVLIYFCIFSFVVGLFSLSFSFPLSFCLTVSLIPFLPLFLLCMCFQAAESAAVTAEPPAVSVLQLYMHTISHCYHYFISNSTYAIFKIFPTAAEATNGSTEVEMPPGFLYKVQTMHDYAANDTDELEMKAGDTVLVVTFDNADEQDEGWLMGVREVDWIEKKDLSKKGVFPENFTQKM